MKGFNLAPTTDRAKQGPFHGAQPWVDGVARVGFVAKGAIYLVVGFLALTAALGVGGTVTDPAGALVSIGRIPGGRFTLALLAVGLAAHVMFRVLLAVVDEPYAEQGRWRKIGRRIKNAFAALLYGGLTVSAVALAVGSPGFAHTDHDGQARWWSGRALEMPYGQFLLLAIAAGIFIGAAVEVARGVGHNDIRRHLRTEEMSESLCRALAVLGRVAFLARAGVLISVGYFLTRVGLERTAGDARGPGGALHGTQEQPGGDLILGLIAVGLIAFGLYAVLEARWRRLFHR